MINLYLKSLRNMRCENLTIPLNKTARLCYGAATLLFAVILMVLATLIVIFAASYNTMQTKATANLNRGNQAFEAAEAGLEYAINYLQQNYLTIIASPSSGFINYTNSGITNVAASGSGTFSIVYTNPTANDYTLITITSTGTSSDGTTTRVIKQNVKRGSLLLNPGTAALVSKGSVSVSGNGTVANTNTNQTIQSALGVTFSGSGETITSSGTSSNVSITRSDVTQNSSTLANMSQNDFFASYFGTTNTATIKNQMGQVFTNSANTNYSTNLNNLTGNSVWIDQTGGSTASITGNTTIGSAANPVLLIVNGNLDISGNVTIYGFVFGIGTSAITTLTGNINIIGGLATSDNLSISGNTTLTFNPTVLNNLQNNPNMIYFAKIPGSWRDF